MESGDNTCIEASGSAGRPSVNRVACVNGEASGLALGLVMVMDSHNNHFASLGCTGATDIEYCFCALTCNVSLSAVAPKLSIYSSNDPETRFPPFECLRTVCAMCCPIPKTILTYKGEEENISAVLGTVAPRDMVSNLAFAPVRAMKREAETTGSPANAGLAARSKSA